MSAPSSVDADKAALTRFDHYPNLPAELRIKVIHEFIADLHKRNPPRGRQKLAPFTALDSEWQHELEPQEQLWGSLRLATEDLPAYRSMLNQLRSSSLSDVVLWIRVVNRRLDPYWEGYRDLGPVTVQSIVHKSVVDSLCTLFECLNYAKSPRPQPARKGVKIHTQITVPDVIRFGEHSHMLSDMEFDFSQLPLTDVIRGFSQVGFVNLKKTSEEDSWQQYKGEKLLSRSSLLSLFSLMPNLEYAQVRLDTGKETPGNTTTGFNNCPKLKTLSLLASGGSLPGTALSDWVSNWSHNIVKLRLRNTTHIPDFLRSLATSSPDTGTITWPNLEDFRIFGWYHPVLGPGGRGDHLHSVLGGIPSALISMPKVKTMAIFLSCPQRRLSTVKTALYLQDDRSKLIISVRDIYAAKRRQYAMGGMLGPNAPWLWEVAADLWDLANKGSVMSATADIQAAVQTQHGQHVEVIIQPDPW